MSYGGERGSLGSIKWQPLPFYGSNHTDDDEAGEDKPQRVDLALQIQLLEWLDRRLKRILQLTDDQWSKLFGHKTPQPLAKTADIGGKNPEPHDSEESSRR